MTLYLVWHQPGAIIEQELRQALDRFELQPGLLLVDSELSRSKLYHQIKWALPKDTPLLVAPLEDAPKFKGMETGALNWVKSRG
ncbi:MAG: hypothetical protein ABR601_06920 [Parasphingopyxis sp.]|nr:hypothetical protein [Sphingomonadales bacterium]